MKSSLYIPLLSLLIAVQGLSAAASEKSRTWTSTDSRELEVQLATVTAERDARPTQAAYDAAVATAHTHGQEDVTTDPASYNLVTQASYDVVVAERDARPTLAEVQDARVGSIVLAKDWQTNAVSLCFGLQKTDDFVSWTAFEGGTWSDAPNGEFKLTLPLGESKKWLRLTLPE